MDISKYYLKWHVIWRKKTQTLKSIIITGWRDIAVSQEEIEKLSRCGIKVTVVNDEKEIPSAAPMEFTFQRVSNLTDKVIEATKGTDYIIYDFFAMEGYLAGKKLNIPTICSMPAIIGKFDPTHELYQQGIEYNKKYILELEEKYGVSILNNLEMVSDGFYLPSDYQNIIWSWPKLIKFADKSLDYSKNRHFTQNYIFIRPKVEDCDEASELIDLLKTTRSKGKKVIYVSLGTVVTKNLWDHEVDVRDFVNTIFNTVLKKYADHVGYEVVVSAGGNVKDLKMFDKLPRNFHVYESVNQKAVLQNSDLFLTHGGGNSVNDAIDAETPMVVIPFFGDQHLCAQNVNQIKIGEAFLHEEKDKNLAVNTRSKLFFRKSFSEGALIDAMEKVIHDPLYLKHLRQVKSEHPIMLGKLSKAMLNRSAMDWKEGDLLFGSSVDRNQLAYITLQANHYRMGDMRPFSTLFADIEDKRILPRIVDQYHDVLTSPAYSDELKTASYEDYRNHLEEYADFLRAHPQYLKPINKLEEVTGDKGKAYLETLWNMCLGGLDFFINHKQATIHFVIGKYNNKYNDAPIKEIQWIKNNWHNEKVRQHVKFYVMQDGLLNQVDPVALQWFESVRPTPSFTDIAPQNLPLDAKDWKHFVSEVSQSHHLRPTLFKNHLGNHFRDEIKKFEDTKQVRIDVKLFPQIAKNSLLNGEVYIFALLPDNKLIITPKKHHSTVISHAALANNSPVLCTGEVRMRRICVNNNWIHVLDISNDSGHYMPDAKGLPQVINSFENAGFKVHRVNAIHTKIRNSFDKVENEKGDFAPIHSVTSFDDSVLKCSYSLVR